MEEDILNYSPTVMFRGTLCRLLTKEKSTINSQFQFFFLTLGLHLQLE